VFLGFAVVSRWAGGEGSGGQVSTQRGGLSPVMACIRLRTGGGRRAPGGAVWVWPRAGRAVPSLCGVASGCWSGLAGIGGEALGRGAGGGSQLVGGGGFALTWACSRPAFRPRCSSVRRAAHRLWCPWFRSSLPGGRLKRNVRQQQRRRRLRT